MAKTPVSARSWLAQNIIRRREAKGWSQADLAEEVGIHVNIIKKIEGDKGEGEQSTRIAIAGALGTSLSELYGEFPPPASAAPAANLDDVMAVLNTILSRLPDPKELLKTVHALEVEVARLKGQNIAFKTLITTEEKKAEKKKSAAR